MQTVREVESLRETVSHWRAAGDGIALVPTMGALHAGHLALIAAARARAPRTIASIFVNPKQFGPKEDLSRYPRQEEADAAVLAESGCDLLWLPTVAIMYPDGFSTNVTVAGVSEGFDGAARPGHFDGVATVVAKLFNQVRPDVAIFGEKDFQQLAVIRRLNADLDFGIEIVGAPTVRDADGLALSSRNAYLSSDERAAAAALPGALRQAVADLESGVAVATALDRARGTIEQAGFVIDYVDLAHAETLGSPVAGEPARLLAAARIGKTRLIDNFAVNKFG